MARTYTLKRRGEQQAETKRRIVEAAVDLHTSLGPALTTLSMVAERAGVQRHTLYAHFPDELSLFMACSGLAAERDPMPDPEPWRSIGDSGDRLRTGLAAIYAWYERNASLAACVLRDAQFHDTTRKIFTIRFAPILNAYRDVLGQGCANGQSAMMELALSFHTWRTLVQESGLASSDAVDAMLHAIEAADDPAATAFREERPLKNAGNG